MAETAEIPSCISCTNGSYVLTTARGRVAGDYDYDPRTGELWDQKTRALVGRFTYDPIGMPSEEPFSEKFLDDTADKDLPVIAVVRTEIMKEIQEEFNAGAFFVLPSQLNGAEYPCYSSVVQQIDDYKFDNTGGPRGQLAVHPAAGQFILDNAACDGREGGINAIDEVLAACHKDGRGVLEDYQLCNGYLQMPMPKGGPEADRAWRVFVNHLHLLRPLIMADVPACGLRPDKRLQSDATHTVGLVYASAVPVNAYNNQAAPGSAAEVLHKKVAEAILVAQYYGALSQLSGRGTAEKPVKVYLMPLGGGVFNNAWESIAKAMSLAVERLASEDANLLKQLDIRALAWEGNPSEFADLRALLSKHGKFRQ